MLSTSARRAAAAVLALAASVALSLPAAPTRAAGAPRPAADSLAGAAPATLAVDGEIETVVGDDFHAGTSREQHSLLLADGTRLRISAGALGRLPVAGHLVGRLLLTDRAAALVESAGVDLSGSESLESGGGLGHRVTALVAAEGITLPVASATVAAEPTGIAPAPAAHHAYVAIVSNAGSYDGQTDAQLAAKVATATGFWVEQSDQVISSFDLAEVVSYSSTAVAADASCGLNGGSGPDTMWNEADDLFPGVDFDKAPNHLVVLLPDECAQNGGAVGYGRLGTSVGNGGRVLAAAEGGSAINALAHEMGHNFSLRHANARTCSPYNPDACSAGEYEDLYDVMGFASEGVLTALNSANRADLGILDPAETQRVELAPTDSTLTTTARILPRTSPEGQRTLTVVDPEDLRTFYLDYRSGTGRDSGALYTTGYRLFGDTTYGAGLTILSSNPDHSSMLWTRAVDASDHRGSWQEGEVFTNPSGSVSVTVQHVEPGQYADVTVQLHTDRQPFVDPPQPVLTGEPEVGDSLTVDPGVWSDGTLLTMAWTLDGMTVMSGGSPYSGRTLYLSPGDRGKVVQAVVTAAADGRRTLAQRTAVVGPVARHVQGYAFLSAYPLGVGKPVFSSVGFTPADAHVDFQWKAGGEAIPGATGDGYVPTTADVGKMITLTVTATAPDYDPITITSDPLGPVPQEGLLSATPTIAGAATFGATLTAQPGTWSDGTTFVYAWLRDGAPIAGAAGATYSAVLADLGTRLRVRVTGTKPGFEPVVETSGPTAMVVPATLAAPRPRITGIARVGRTLTALPGAWTAGTTLRYQWLANGAMLRGATQARYPIPKAVRGKRLAVRVTGRKSGYATLARTSFATKAVLR